MEKIIVYGLGFAFYQLKVNNIFTDKEIVAYCDSDVNKQEAEFYGKIVISPGDIKNYAYDKIYVTSFDYYDEMYDSLCKLGVDLKNIYKPELELNKHDSELTFWKAHYEMDGGFKKEEYIKRMSTISGTDDSIFENKVVVDFGCGPKGSLVWIKKPCIKIGVDVLAGEYFESFPDELSSHEMVYVTSTESVIPLSTGYADVLITMNSLDHVENLETMCSELVRILKMGGILLASFNLNEVASPCEPQCLTEKILYDNLICHFDVLRTAQVDMDGNVINISNDKKLLDSKGAKIRITVMAIKTNNKRDNFWYR